MHYILILMLGGGNYQSSPAVVSVLFDTMTACETAGKKSAELWNNGFGNAVWTCNPSDH